MSALLITTQYGTIQGHYEEGVPTWKGIPYATLFPDPKISRFRKAAPCLAWEGTLEAKDFSPPIPQVPKPLSGIDRNTPVSETSLTLNIWKPANHNEPKPLPVLIWIYGGAFVNGSATLDMYDGKELARREKLIVVTFDYRVGALGMMDFSSFDPRFESNVGLKDQLMALQWVYENIAAFGGDPQNITISGQSAGANSVTTLLTIPQARPYIAKAAAISSYPGSTNTKAQAAQYAKEFLTRIGMVPECPGEMDKLYEMDAMDLMRASVDYADTVSARALNGFPFLPVIDGDFLPEFPLTAVRKAPADRKKIPLILGNCENEGSLYAKQPIPLITVTESTCHTFFQHYEGTDAPVTKALFQYYQDTFQKKFTFSAMGGDIVFRIPSQWYADGYSQYQDTFVYNFCFVSNLLSWVGLGTIHGCDIPFLFHTTQSKIAKLGLLLDFKRTSAYSLSSRMNEMLGNFCRTGNAGWELYTSAARPVYQFDIRDRLLYNPLGKAMELWSSTKYYDYLMGGSYDK